MTPLDRLKLAREDFDQQEKLYNTLVLGLRFYIGIAALLGGWSISLFRIEAIEPRWDVAAVVGSTAIFWIVLACAIVHLFQLIRGDHWSIPRTLDHYLNWERDRLKQLSSGEFETGEKSPSQFAEDEMIVQMMGAYADAACVNRAGNLSRQIHVTKVGKWLLVAVVALGAQGMARMIYVQRHGEQRKQTAETTTAATAAPGPGGHNKP